MLCSVALLTVMSLGASLGNAPAQSEYAAAFRSAADRAVHRVDTDAGDRSAWIMLAQEINPDKQAGPRIQPQPIPGGPRSFGTPRSISQNEGPRDNDLPGRGGRRDESLMPRPGR